MKRMITQELIDELSSIIEQGGFEWVLQIKDLISYDDNEGNIVLNGNTGIEIAHISHIVNNDKNSYFPELTNKAGKCVVVNEDEEGFEYKKSPTFWETDDNLDNLSSELLEQLQKGDIIFSSADEESAFVDYIYVGTSTDIIIKEFNSLFIILFTYTKESDEWSCIVDEAPLTMSGLTHSFNELDPTLKSICETAISTGDAQSCSHEQWSVIKALLDKSLYFNFSGQSMIKTYFNGINSYTFGIIDEDNLGAILEFAYNSSANTISVSYTEV